MLRLATNGRVFRLPSQISEVFEFVRAVAAQPNCERLEPGRRHLDLLASVCAEGRVVSDLVNTAVLAAIAVEHGPTVASFDRDFARFPNLRWIVPGADATS